MFTVVQLLSHVRLCDLADCSPPGTSVQWDFPGKNIGVGCHFLLQGIFPTQGSNPGLLYQQVDSLPPSHREAQSNYTSIKKKKSNQKTWTSTSEKRTSKWLGKKKIWKGFRLIQHQGIQIKTTLTHNTVNQLYSNKKLSFLKGDLPFKKKALRKTIIHVPERLTFQWLTLPGVDKHVKKLELSHTNGDYTLVQTLY